MKSLPATAITIVALFLMCTRTPSVSVLLVCAAIVCPSAVILWVRRMHQTAVERRTKESTK